MAATFSDEEIELHLQKLASFADFRVFPLLTETAFFAIFTVLIFTSSYILITRGIGSRTGKIMLATTLVLYGLSTYDWAIEILFLRDDLKSFLPGDLIRPPPDHTRRIQVNTALHISQSITNNISTMLSDAVVVWRVYVVYGRSKRVLAMGIALLTALFSGLLLCNLTQIGLGFPSVAHLHLLAPAELVIDIVTLIFSALVNIWATALIGYQAWHYRREIRCHLKESNPRSFAQSMLILFTETGVVYTSLWVLKNIIVIPQLVHTPYTIYANSVMYQMTGMYPTVIIILVALQKSHLEHQFTNYGGASGSKDIAFASGPTSTTATSSSALDPRFRGGILVSRDILTGKDAESQSDLGSKAGHDEITFRAMP